MDPDDFVAEIRLTPEEEFQRIHEFWLSVYEIAHPDAFDEVWADLPDVWTDEFKAMARVWARLLYIAEFGASMAQRYASEPHSSLDHFFLPSGRVDG
jgi:hypothetical protein